MESPSSTRIESNKIVGTSYSFEVCSIALITQSRTSYQEVLTMSNVAKKRHQAAVRQSYHCFYCGLPMWESTSSEFITHFGLSAAEARFLQCTGEHMNPRCDGGTNDASNIVAACRHCNSTRHKAAKVLKPDQYRKKVQERIRKGAWFPKSVLQKLGAQKFS